MSANKGLIEKIKKLLSLATSPNEFEAKAAAAKAEELLVEHNLDLQTVERTMSDYERIDTEPSSRTGSHGFFVAKILVGYFFVEVIHRRDRNTKKTAWVLIGEKTNVAVAFYMYAFLDRKFPELWTVYKKQTKADARDRKSYYRGLCMGICKQLEEKRSTVQADRGLVLVRDPRLEEATKTLANPTGTLKQKSNGVNPEVLKDGFEHGRGLHLVPAITNQRKESGALLE